MTEEEKKEYAKNCYDGLNSLNSFVDVLLSDEKFSGDEDLLKTKEEIKNNLSNLEKVLDEDKSTKSK